MDITQIVNAQKDFFSSGKTRFTEFRRQVLGQLYAKIQEMEPEIHAALRQDLGKSSFESYMCEVGMTLSEITHMKKHLKRYAAPRRAKTPLAQFPARSYSLKEPYGCTLVMSPWNYPFLLTMEPMVDAIAAGNTVVLKPSAYAPATAGVMKKLVEAVFHPGHVALVEGGREENARLLEQEFDYIFFTGGTEVGKLVLRKAAEHFTPVTLEMGGKSPCIVDETADLRIAAKRIAFGKFLNCGQTCVAPDYLFVQESVMDKFLPLLFSAVEDMYGREPLKNPDYGNIINRRHFDRLTGILEGETVLFGGACAPETLQIAPTVLGPVSPHGPAMAQELFGPLLPVMPYKHLEQVVEFVSRRPKPLALYLFSKNQENISQIQTRLSYGGGCINDTIIHLATSDMGFGGVGMSGMGAYHGKHGFDTFSHEKSIVRKACWLDLPMRYQKYTKGNERLLRLFLR